MKPEAAGHQDGESDSIRSDIDPLLVAAYRLGSHEPELGPLDLGNASDDLTEEDRQSLEGVPANVGERIVFGQLQETGGLRVSVTTKQGAGDSVAQDEHALENRELLLRYDTILSEKCVAWTSEFRWKRRLGAGGQGVVYLSEIRGNDDFAFPVALKIFSPERFRNPADYEMTMRRIAQISSRVAQIHHENLLDVQAFLQRDGIRMVIMEFIDGYDLRRLLVTSLLAGLRNQVSSRRWEYINRVIITDGPDQPRLKAGVAVDIIRDCLSALAELHRASIVHGDIKPSNIMLKRSGTAKIIDMGSAFDWNDRPPQLNFTLAYAAPEVIEQKICTPQSDLASLGYVLVELLSGRAIFGNATDERELLEVKRTLPRRLEEIFPEEVRQSDVLMTFCRRLIAPDPNRRFASAEEADLQPNEGASAFHFQLVRGNLASVFHNDMRIWIEAVRQWDETRGVVPE